MEIFRGKKKKKKKNWLLFWASFSPQKFLSFFLSFSTRIIATKKEKS
jgi:hypothetical protein